MMLAGLFARQPSVPPVVELPQDQELERLSQLADLVCADPVIFEALTAAGKQPECRTFLRRWLVAADWNVEDAQQAVRKHAAWAQQHAPALPVDDMDARALLPNELKLSKLFLLGFDDLNHPVLLIKMAAHCPHIPFEERVLSLIWCMEHLCKLADAQPRGDGKVCLIFDMRGYGMHNVDIHGATTLVDMLQSHYPERMAHLFILDAPGAFWIVWNVIQPFMNPKTKRKVQMVAGEDGIRRLHAVIPKDVLPVHLAGTASTMQLLSDRVLSPE